jgi:hypothetical protein
MTSYRDPDDAGGKAQSGATGVSGRDLDPRHDDGPGRDTFAGRTGADDGARPAPADRHSVVAREKERYGGIKWGSAFFGWLTATGTGVLLTALVAAAGAALGVANNTDASRAAGQATQKAATVGIAGSIALIVILLIAYYCGGYVAGRMARFNGAKQGVAVWVWSIVIAVVVAVTGILLGAKYDVLAKLGGFPRLPLNEGAVTTGGIIAVVLALLAALVGAILGGLAGMRFHRNVDKAGLGR